jgi:branched-chain amino acid transport system ATP-binding protein
MTLLDVRSLDAFYGDFQAIFGLDFTVAAGESVALVGANGAGKSTFLKSLVGLMDQRRGMIRFDGHEISGMPAEKISRLGLCLVPEGRMLFASLSVEENLGMGALNGRPGSWTLQRVFKLFPVLAEKRNEMPGRLSGGQQQMVAIGRALMSNPRLLLCDELSLGLAPVVIEEIYRSLGDIRREGTAVVLVEQDVKRAYATVDRIYCLLKGRITLEAAARSVSLHDLTRAYFGT